MASHKNTTLGKLLGKLLIKDELNDMKVFRKSDDIKKHLNDYADKMKDLGIDIESEKCQYLLKTLDDECVLELKAQLDYQGNAKNFEYLTTTLIKIFGNNNSTIKEYSAILNCKQKLNQSLRDFLSEVRIKCMRTISCQEPEEREQMMLTAFQNGLLNRKFEIILKQVAPKTLNEAFEILKNEKDEVRNEEEIYAMEESTDISDMKLLIKELKSRVTHLEGELNLLKGNRRNQFQRSNSNLQKFDRSFQQKEITCFNCQRSGHIARNCKNQTVCKICHKTGHSDRNCYAKNKNVGRFRNIEEESVTSEPNTIEVMDNAERDVELDSQNETKPAKKFFAIGNYKSSYNRRKAMSDKDRNVEDWVKYVCQGRRKPKTVIMDNVSKHKSTNVRQVNYDGKTVISSSSLETAHNKPVIDGVVDGSAKRLFFDSGCESNVMDYAYFLKLARRNSAIKILRKSGRLSCANGSPMKIIGYSIINVGMGKQQQPMKFSIVNQISPNVIIGIKYMKSARIVIDAGKDKVINGLGEEIPFVSKTETTQIFNDEHLN